MKIRTKQFAIDTIIFCESLPRGNTYYRMSDQLLRAATSVGANYRAACRSRSKAEFFSKLSIVVEEGDECGFWLELFIESGKQNTEEAHDLLSDANEITSILAKARKTVSNK
ncbi:MAG: four helix bundle protein [Bacteroidales bacterium]|nr:four helix bundle protein [Bacteroidales bacterium]